MEPRRPDLQAQAQMGRSEAGDLLCATVAPPRDLRDFPMRTLNRPPPRVEVNRTADGTTYVTSGYVLEKSDELLIDCIAHAATIRPDVTFLAERGSDRQWRRLT